MKRLTLAFLILTTFSFCPSRTQHQQIDTESNTEIAPVNINEEPVIEEDPWYIVGVTSIRKEPHKGRQTKNHPTGKSVSNYITLLFRGEPVKVIEENSAEGWSKIEVSGGTKGHVENKRLIQAENLAAIKGEAKIFARPNLMHVTKNKFIGGEFVFVDNEVDGFVNVTYANSYYSGKKVWVQKSSLIYDENQLNAAKLLMKFKYQFDKDIENAPATADFIASDFQDTEAYGHLQKVLAENPQTLPESLIPIYEKIKPEVKVEDTPNPSDVEELDTPKIESKTIEESDKKSLNDIIDEGSSEVKKVEEEVNSKLKKLKDMEKDVDLLDDL